MKWFRTTSYNDGVVTPVVNQSDCVSSRTSLLVYLWMELPRNRQPRPSMTRRLESETFIQVRWKLPHLSGLTLDLQLETMDYIGTFDFWIKFIESHLRSVSSDRQDRGEPTTGTLSNPMLV